MRGFTLIEMLLAITIVALLVGLGAPSLGDYLANSRIASATQSLHAGLSTARAEAIRRNEPVQFVMTNSPVSASDAASTAVPSATGVNWLVSAPGSDTPVDAKAAGEGSGSAVRIDVSSSAAFAGSITFNGTGGTADLNTYIFDLSSPNSGTCADVGGPMRCKRIRVAPGGQMFLCDPAVTSNADNRFCR